MPEAVYFETQFKRYAPLFIGQMKPRMELDIVIGVYVLYVYVYIYI